MSTGLAGVEEVGVDLGDIALLDLGLDGSLGLVEVCLLVAVRLFVGRKGLAAGTRSSTDRAGAAAERQLALSLGCNGLGDGGDAALFGVAVGAGLEGVKMVGFLDSDGAFNHLGFDLSDFLLELGL
jgi:hypothetical protein